LVFPWLKYTIKQGESQKKPALPIEIKLVIPPLCLSDSNRGHPDVSNATFRLAFPVAFPEQIHLRPDDFA
jgi:hypothetical protein